MGDRSVSLRNPRPVPLLTISDISFPNFGESRIPLKFPKSRAVFWANPAWSGDTLPDPVRSAAVAKASLSGAAQRESASLWAAHQANLSFSFAKTNQSATVRYASISAGAKLAGHWCSLMQGFLAKGCCQGRGGIAGLTVG